VNDGGDSGDRLADADATAELTVRRRISSNDRVQQLDILTFVVPAASYYSYCVPGVPSELAAALLAFALCYSIAMARIGVCPASSYYVAQQPASFTYFQRGFTLPGRKSAVVHVWWIQDACGGYSPWWIRILRRIWLARHGVMW